MIEDSSDTETETEKEEEEEEETEGEEEGKKEVCKRRRVFDVKEPTLARRDTLNNSNVPEVFQPVPSVSIEPPVPSASIEPPQSPLPELDVNMDIVALMTEHGM